MVFGKEFESVFGHRLDMINSVGDAPAYSIEVRFAGRDEEDVCSFVDSVCGMVACCGFDMVGEAVDEPYFVDFAYKYGCDGLFRMFFDAGGAGYAVGDIECGNMLDVGIAIRGICSDAARGSYRAFSKVGE